MIKLSYIHGETVSYTGPNRLEFVLALGPAEDINNKVPLHT
jgi:hypothetical protein